MLFQKSCFQNQSTAKFASQPKKSRFFEVFTSTEVKKGERKPSLVMTSTPIQYCEKCDLRFATAMRLYGHEKLCGITKDPLSPSKSTTKTPNERIYVCRKCHRTLMNPLLMFTHLRRCTVSSNESGNYKAFFSCGICRHNCVSLGEIEAHLNMACPILHPAHVKKEVDNEDDDVMIL